MPTFEAKHTDFHAETRYVSTRKYNNKVLSGLRGEETLPSLIIIEDADLRDATEWGALNRKSRLLCFARICNLLRGGMNSLFIEI